eukprot:751246-Amphidinium_carterae.1
MSFMHTKRQPQAFRVLRKPLRMELKAVFYSPLHVLVVQEAPHTEDLFFNAQGRGFISANKYHRG